MIQSNAQLWRIIAEAFLRKAASGKLSEKNAAIAKHGLCYATGEISESGSQENAMDAAVLNESRCNADPYYTNDGSGPYLLPTDTKEASNVRGMLALLFAEFEESK